MPKFIKLTEHSTGTVYFVNANKIQLFHFWDTKTKGTCTHIDMGRSEMQVKESVEEILALIEKPDSLRAASVSNTQTERPL